MSVLPAHQSHPRVWENFKYVYPVLSRRSRGIPIGINVNPDKVCKFDCIYCQVDRTVPATLTKFDFAVAEQELREILKVDFSQHPPFDSVPKDRLRLDDIALSGDAEPTTLRNFSATVEMIARVKPAGVKIVLITDAGGLDRPDVQRAGNHGRPRRRGVGQAGCRHGGIFQVHQPHEDSVRKDFAQHPDDGEGAAGGDPEFVPEGARGRAKRDGAG